MTLPPSKQSSATKSTAPQPYHCNIVLQTNAMANTRQTVSAIIYLIYQKTGWHQKDTIQENKQTYTVKGNNNKQLHRAATKQYLAIISVQ